MADSVERIVKQAEKGTIGFEIVLSVPSCLSGFVTGSYFKKQSQIAGLRPETLSTKV